MEVRLSCVAAEPLFLLGVRTVVDGERRDDDHLLVHVVGVRDDDAVLARGTGRERKTIAAFAVFLGRERQEVERVALHVESADGRNDGRTVLGRGKPWKMRNIHLTT